MCIFQWIKLKKNVHSKSMSFSGYIEAWHKQPQLVYHVEHASLWCYRGWSSISTLFDQRREKLFRKYSQDTDGISGEYTHYTGLSSYHSKITIYFFSLNYLFLLFNLIPHYICCLQNQYRNCMHLIVQIYFELYLGGLISKLLLLSFIFFNCHLRIKYKVLI